MEYTVFKNKLYLSLLKISLGNEKNISPPEGAPEWLGKLLTYHFSEYDNSKTELYQIVCCFEQSNDFIELQQKIIGLKLL
jgi:hypothetical protein